jgi:hypothetical protein
VRLLLSDNPIPWRALNSTEFIPDRLVITTASRYRYSVFLLEIAEEGIYNLISVEHLPNPRKDP